MYLTSHEMFKLISGLLFKSMGVQRRTNILISHFSPYDKMGKMVGCRESITVCVKELSKQLINEWLEMYCVNTHTVNLI